VPLERSVGVDEGGSLKLPFGGASPMTVSGSIGCASESNTKARPILEGCTFGWIYLMWIYIHFICNGLCVDVSPTVSKKVSSISGFRIVRIVPIVQPVQS
jgi:hypothetical protein